MTACDSAARTTGDFPDPARDILQHFRLDGVLDLDVLRDRTGIRLLEEVIEAFVLDHLDLPPTGGDCTVDLGEVQLRNDLDIVGPVDCKDRTGDLGEDMEYCMPADTRPLNITNADNRLLANALRLRIEPVLSQWVSPM